MSEGQHRKLEKVEQIYNNSKKIGKIIIKKTDFKEFETNLKGYNQRKDVKY